MNTPVRPGILVQRQSKEEMNTSLGNNIKAEEYKNRQTHEPASARDTSPEVTRALSRVAYGRGLTREESHRVGVIRS